MDDAHIAYALTASVGISLSVVHIVTPAMLELINFTACSQSLKSTQSSIIHASFDKNKNLAMIGITQKSLFMPEKYLFWYCNVHGRQVK